MQKPENEAKVNIHMNSIFILTKFILVTLDPKPAPHLKTVVDTVHASVQA